MTKFIVIVNRFEERTSPNGGAVQYDEFGPLDYAGGRNVETPIEVDGAVGFKFEGGSEKSYLPPYLTFQDEKGNNIAAFQQWLRVMPVTE